MEVIVLWADSAIDDLQKIHDYLISVTSEKVADKTANTIVDKSILLEKNPRMGQLEHLLSHRKEEIRYLIHGNYKIVYIVDGNYFIVATVFDCRQDPQKLENIKM